MIVRNYEKKDIKTLNNLGKHFKKNFEINLDIFSNCIVLDDNNNIIGFAIYSLIYDRAEIVYIIIEKLYQGKGYSKLLMNRIIEDCKIKNCKNITLEVNCKNKIAIKLYEKYGFNIVSIRKNYYEKNDGYLMEKIF